MIISTRPVRMNIRRLEDIKDTYLHLLDLTCGDTFLSAEIGRDDVVLMADGQMFDHTRDEVTALYCGLSAWLRDADIDDAFEMPCAGDIDRIREEAAGDIAKLDAITTLVSMREVLGTDNTISYQVASELHQVVKRWLVLTNVKYN